MRLAQEPVHDPDEAAPELRSLLRRHGLDGMYEGAALGDACRDAAYALGIPFRQAPFTRLSEIAHHAATAIVKAHGLAGLAAGGSDAVRVPVVASGSAGRRQPVGNLEKRVA